MEFPTFVTFPPLSFFNWNVKVLSAVVLIENSKVAFPLILFGRLKGLKSKECVGGTPTSNICIHPFPPAPAASSVEVIETSWVRICDKVDPATGCAR